ncbi:uncharacterized protein LOC141910927 isoform X2 [Tubulanus polymorphus]|uniref:uncharacterized protein LOC141910927 isoform X2 n=1 Tax=Tubulanus polymorphus TaxID=672921 RepID=UPI003DA54F79
MDGKSRRNGVKPSEQRRQINNDKGSSVDLAPSLLTLYDDYGLHNHNHGIKNSPPPPPPPDNSSFLSRAPANYNADLCLVENRNMSETGVLTSTSSALIKPSSSTTTTTTRTNGESLSSKVSVPSPVKVTDPAVALVSTAKRPLSISSTSSSTSSTSSLNRSSCKKMAGDPSSRCQLSPPFERKDCESFEDMQSDDDLLEGQNEDAALLDESDSILVSPQKLENSESTQSIMDRVVAEVLDTERTYVRDLQEIIEGYLNFFTESGNDLFPAETLQELFGNIRELHNFNSGFLENLELCEIDPVKVANCFVDHQNGFSIYADYCTNYPMSMAMLTTCMRQPEIGDAFKQRQIALSHALPLGSYLLKPVQRILKYHLLLQNMLNNVDESMDGYETISEALSGMTNMARHINEMKRKHEHAVRIQEIQSILYQWQGEDLTTYGELLAEDTFRMYGAKAYRHLFLFEKTLLITKRKEDGSLSCKACIMCSNLMLIESIPKEPLSFHVIPFNNPKNQYTLQAKTLDQKRRWCQEIKRLILENYNAIIPDKAKKLVMMLGDIDGDNRNMENIDPSKHRQHNAPEYLDKRKGRRKSGTFIPDFHILRSQRTKKVLNRKSDVFSSPKAELSNGTPGRTRKVRQPRPRSRSVDYGGELTNLMEKHQEEEENEDQIETLKEMDNETVYEACNLPARAENEDTAENGMYSTLKRRLAQFARRESFRIATELNRVDSKSIADRKSRTKHRSMPKRDQQHHSSSESMDLDSDDNTENSSNSNQSKQRFDDDYVTLAYKDGHCELVNPPDSDDESLYLNVQFARSKKSGAKSEENLGDYIDLSEAREILREHCSSSSLPSYNKTRTNGQYGDAVDQFESKDISYSDIDDDDDENDEDGFALLEEECKSLTLPKNTNPCGIYDNLLFGAAYREHMMQILSKGKRADTEDTDPLDTDDDKFKPGCRRSVSFDEKDLPWLKIGSMRINNKSSPNSDLKSPTKQSVNRSHSFSGKRDSSEQESKPAKPRRKNSITSLSGLAELFGRGSLNHSRESLSGKYGENHPKKQLGVHSPTSPRDVLYNMLTSSKDRLDVGNINASFSDDHICESLSSSRSESLSEDLPVPSAKLTDRMVLSAQSSPIHKPHIGLRLSKTSPFSLSWRNDNDNKSVPKTKSELWNDLEEYIANTPDTPPLLPKFPVDIQPGESDCVTTSSAVSTPSSDVSSPSHLPSTENLMGTLKHAVTNIKTKISRKSSNPPSQFHKRSDNKSTEELDKVNSDSLTSAEEPNVAGISDCTDTDGPIVEPNEEETSEQQRKFVFQLARSYSSRIKKDKVLPKDALTKHINSMMNKDSKKSKPIELGSTSLTRQRPPRPQRSYANNSPLASCVELTCERIAEMSCKNAESSNSYSDVDSCKETGEEYIKGLQNLACHNSSGSDAGDEMSRHDDDPDFSPHDAGCSNGQVVGKYQGITIRDTVRMIEQRNYTTKVNTAKPPLPVCEKSGTLRRERGSMIAERLKSLEKSSQSTLSGSPRLSRAKYRDYGIRFTSGAMSDCGGYDGHSSDASEDPGMMSDPGTNRDSQELDAETLANMRGLVKQLVTKFQSDKPPQTDEEC